MSGDPSIMALATEVMKRQMAQRDAAAKVMPHGPLVPDASNPMTPIATPKALGWLGPMVDAASTYAFLKRGTGVEDNAQFQRKGAIGTAASVAGDGMKDALMRQLVRRVLPKLSPAMDLMDATEGAQGIGLAGNNMRDVMNPSSGQLYMRQVGNAITR